MELKELLEKLAALRGERVVSYSCECCGTGYEWESDPKFGDYLRWEDVKELLEKFSK